MKDISLVVFTLLMQASIGTYIWRFYSIYKNKDNKDNKSIYVVFLLGIFAIIFSLTHLGAPEKAYNALNNIGSSWLSAEILLTSLFVILVFVEIVLARTNKFNSSEIYLSITLIVVGICDIFAISSVYSSTIVPAWIGYSTFIYFATTSMTLGGTIILLFLDDKDDIYFLAKFIVVALIVQFAVKNYSITELAHGQWAARATLMALSDQVSVLVFKWLAFILSIALLLKMIRDGKSNKPYAYGTFVFLFVGQLIERISFYGASVYMGILS